MGHRLHVIVLRGVWGAAFMAVVFTPLYLSARAGGRGDLIIELSLTLGLLGFSLLWAAVVLASRLRSVTLAFGIERILRSHRWLALTVTGLVLAHLGMVIADHPGNLALLDVRSAPPRARAATAATLALICLCVLSVWRKRLRTRYQWWHGVHVVLAVVALGGTLLHVLWLNHLLKDEAMRAFFGFAAGLMGLLFVQRWVRRPLRALRSPYVVLDLRQESPTVTTLVLVPKGRRQPAVRFRPGQFAWIRAGSVLGAGESHPFTIASGSHNPGVLEFSIKHAGDWTGALERWRPGRSVYVDGPHGDFSVDSRRSKRLLLVAAGVGMTPMMSILRTLADRGDERPVRLITGARTVDELLFREEVGQLGRLLRLTVTEVLSDPPPGWQGASGRVGKGVLATALRGRSGVRGIDAYICGPPGMVAGAAEALIELGVPPQHVHTEQFDMV